MSLVILVFLVAFLAIIYGYFVRLHYQFWKRKAVPSVVDSLFFGTLKDALLFRESIAITYVKLYNKFKKRYRYLGVFEVKEPALLVLDVQLAKNILLNDSRHFIDNGFDVDEKSDPLFGKNPFFLKGEKWKIGRNKTTPLFTSSKMKSMFNGMLTVAQKLPNYLENNRLKAVSIKELCRRYTADVAGQAAFGLTVKALDDPDSVFMKMYSTIFNDSFWSELKQFVALWLPPFLAALFNGIYVSKETDKFIKDIVDQAVRYRRDNNIVAGDYLGSLLQMLAKKCDGGPLDADAYNEIYVHFVGLLTDGVETTSVFLQFMLYEIAANAVVQERLKEEIDETANKHGQLTYESLHEMAYLDRVFKETLRKYPPLPVNLKVCTEPYVLPPLDDQSKLVVNLEKGVKIVIPTLALHMDPEHFDRPDRFDPDRFLDMNEAGKNAYIPFGEGPRMCIGRRLAEQQSKIAVISIVKKFRIRVSEKMISPIEFAPSIMFMAPKGGIWLDFEKRD